MSMTSLPQRPPQHVTGDRAVNVFKFKLNPSWVTNPSVSDYGWDVLVTITENGQVTDDFFVQLKGHESPGYNVDKSYISEPISIETVNFLLRKPMPVMLCVCDTSNDALFYVWINEDIKRIVEENKEWSKQGSVTFKLRAENIIENSQEVSGKLSDYVTSFYRKSANEKEIVEVLFPSFGIGEDTLRKSSKEESLRVIRPTLEKAGLIDDAAEDIKALSPKDQETLRKVKEISIFLRKYLHKDAKEALDSLSDQIKGAADSVKAKYHNNYGVYYSHTDNLEKALEEYSAATRAASNNYKAITNKAQTEYALSRIGKYAKIHDEWHIQLDLVIANQPDFYSAYRTKAYIIADKENATKAEAYLTATQAWTAEPIEAKVCLADLYVREGNMPDARRVLGDDQNTDNFAYWSLKGFVLFSLSTGVSTEDKDYYLTGIGPSSINRELLMMAEKAYKRACDILVEFGLPVFSDHTIVNYSAVLHLQFKHEVSLDICRQFLAKHPDNRDVKDSIATCYMGLGKPDKAIPFAREAFNLKSNSTTLKNLCICLYEAGEHEECIKIIGDYLESDLAAGEKGLLMSLLTISLNELGSVMDSKKVLEAMKETETYAGEAVSTEAIIAIKNGLGREHSLNLLKNGSEKYPRNMILLSNYATALNPSVKEEAQEIIKCFAALAVLRELFPDEYKLYSRALLMLGEADAALNVISQAVVKFPSDMNLQYELAVSLAEIGAEEDAFNIIERSFSQFTSSYSHIRNFAVLAYRTGRFEQAVKLLQKALGKTTDLEGRGELHCLLFELKRKADYAAKDILLHVHEFGKTIKSDDEQLEARYLSMFMVATINIMPDSEYEC